jgi:HSP20 family protein
VRRPNGHRFLPPSVPGDPTLGVGRSVYFVCGGRWRKVVIKAELPGIDPDKDVEITLRNGVLAISTTRSAEETGDKDGTKFSEFRYGSFHRTLAVPRETNASDVSAEYKDEILTIIVPIPAQKAVEATKVPVIRS